MELISLNIGPVEALEEQISRPGPDSDYWYEYSPAMSIIDALAIPALGSGIRYIAETLASLPIHIYERADDDSRPVAKNHPAYRIVHDAPNEYYTAFELYEQMLRDLLTIGGHLSIVETNGRNDVTAIKPVENWSIHQDQQTKVRLFLVRDGSTVERFVDSQVLFIPGPGSRPFKLNSLIDQHAGTLGISKVAREYVRNYFRKGAVGPIFASFDVTMNQQTKEAWADWFKKNYAGAKNAGSIPIMDGKGKLEALNVDHSKMQLTDIQRLINEECARILRVPQHKMQILDRSTNNNIEHQGIEAVVDCLRPWAKRIESRMTFSLLGPIERERYYIEFDLDGLLRGDSAAQAALMAAEIQNAVATPNEWRRIRNRTRSTEPHADSLFIQGATVPIAMAGTQNQKPAAREAAAK